MLYNEQHAQICTDICCVVWFKFGVLVALAFVCYEQQQKNTQFNVTNNQELRKPHGYQAARRLWPTNTYFTTIANEFSFTIV